MISYYLILLIILFSFGVFNLIWRVKNDAVIYLHSALGRKIAHKWVVLGVAALGLFTGAFFSQGMLEIVRKCVFRPDMFVFSEIMVIFTAMMIADVILMNIFKALEFPSSTIVMVLFELLGASIAVALVKLKSQKMTVNDLPLYINTEKIVIILAGIVVSVVLAFILGAVIQFLVRSLFTFRYRKFFRLLGPVYGAVLITVAFVFILIQGMDGSVFRGMGLNTLTTLLWIKQNIWLVLIAGILVCTFLLWGIRRLFKIDLLNLVILIGTFDLTLCIAANDTVNFIGVPLAGFESFGEWVAWGATTAENFKMEFLLEDIKTPMFFLFITGLMMMGALFSSKKAGKDPESSLSPRQQNEEEEHSVSILIARSITRNTIHLNRRLKNMLPASANRFLQKRFQHLPAVNNAEQQVFSADKIRSSVILFVASIILTVATSFKLPIPTTYVAFMVLLGSSLADQVWGRDSAVYRIAGIIDTMGSWIITSIIAFTVAAFIAWIITVGGLFVNIGLVISIAFIVFRSQVVLHRRNKKLAEDEELINEKDEKEKWIEKCNQQVVKTIISANKIFSSALDSFMKEDRSHMHKTLLMNDDLNQKSRKQKNKIVQTISSVKRMDVDSSYFYIQVIDYQREIAHSLYYILDPLNEHLENQHNPFNDSQTGDIRLLVSEIDIFFNFALHIVKEEKFDTVEELIVQRNRIFEALSEIEKGQINRIKNKEGNLRNSMLFFKALTETKNLLVHSVSMIKSYRDFIMVSRNQG